MKVWIFKNDFHMKGLHSKCSLTPTVFFFSFYRRKKCFTENCQAEMNAVAVDINTAVLNCFP